MSPSRDVRRRAAAGSIALFVALAAGCASRVYRDTWQPSTPQDVYSRLLVRALAIEPSEVLAVERAGGQLIGYHATRKAYSTRAGSVGGTHFVAVSGTTTAHTSCTAAPLGGITLGLCSTNSGFRPSKIAVFRVPPEGWPSLPPHLVPPTSEVEDGVRVYATRDGCSVNGAWGTTKCSNDWKVRTYGAPPQRGSGSSPQASIELQRALPAASGPAASCYGPRPTAIESCMAASQNTSS